MKVNRTLSIFLMLLSLQPEAQEIKVDSISINSIDIRDFLVNDDYLFILADYKIFVYDLNKDSLFHLNNPRRKVISMALSKAKELYLLTDREKLFKINIEDQSLEAIDLIFRNELTGVRDNELKLYVYDRRNIFIDTFKGIYFLRDLKFYYPEYVFNGLDSYSFGEHYDVANVYSWQEDTLWLGYRFGEWGGAYLAFDTKNLEFLTKHRFTENIRSIINYKGNMYASFSLHHLFHVSSGIAKLYPDSTELMYYVDNMDSKSDTNFYSNSRGVYFGPIAPLHDGSGVALYNEKGFFKLSNLHKDSLRYESFVFWFYPGVLGAGGQRFAAGSDIYVTKSIDTRHGFFYLTAQQGVGWLRGNKLTYIR